MSKLRAKKIKLILSDVDGVLTDGKPRCYPRVRFGLADREEEVLKSRRRELNAKC